MKFTHLTRLCLLLPIFLLPLSSAVLGQQKERQEFLRELVRINDEYIPDALKRQVTRNGSNYCGAVFDSDSVVSPIGTSHLIQTLMCSYVSKVSSYYRSRELLDRMTLAARALLDLQHEDGTIDLLTTNFHSTPDLGFTIFPLASSYSIMLQNHKLYYGEFPALVKQYLENAGRALSVGGVHTPNHRWVICAGLAWVNSFFPQARYRQRVEQWLAEKIDIDADGQYNERSTAIYTPITNRSLIDIARKMEIDSLYDVVRKNLDLTLYLVHANGEIVTETSNRQDKYLRRNMAAYFLAYNHLALRDRNDRYAGMVSYILKTVPKEHLLYMLPTFLEDLSLLRPLPLPVAPPEQYHKHFEHSDLVRVRDGQVDMSVITENPTCFTFFKGNAALEAVRLSSAFFGKGQFESQQMKKEGATYILSSTMTGPYYQPIGKEKIPLDTDAWTAIPRSEREQSEVQTLNTRIFITPEKGKARIRVSVDGPRNLPVTLELAFRSGGSLENVIKKTGIANAFLVNEGEFAIYRYGEDSIKVGPGVRAHNWTQLRGALPKLDADCLYFTKYAPCEFEFTLE